MREPGQEGEASWVDLNPHSYPYRPVSKGFSQFPAARISFPGKATGMPTGQREGEGEWLPGEAAVAGHRARLGNQWPALCVPP